MRRAAKIANEGDRRPKNNYFVNGKFRDSRQLIQRYGAAPLAERAPFYCFLLDAGTCSADFFCRNVCNVLSGLENFDSISSSSSLNFGFRGVSV